MYVFYCTRHKRCLYLQSPLYSLCLLLCCLSLPPPPSPSLQAKGVEFVLPTDVIVADKFAPDAATQTVDASAIPDGWMVSGNRRSCGHAACWES